MRGLRNRGRARSGPRWPSATPRGTRCFECRPQATPAPSGAKPAGVAPRCEGQHANHSLTNMITGAKRPGASPPELISQAHCDLDDFDASATRLGRWRILPVVEDRRRLAGTEPDDPQRVSSQVSVRNKPRRNLAPSGCERREPREARDCACPVGSVRKDHSLSVLPSGSAEGAEMDPNEIAVARLGRLG
jgi:hypothetical protein